jgi:hypothetical protein
MNIYFADEEGNNFQEHPESPTKTCSKCCNSIRRRAYLTIADMPRILIIKAQFKDFKDTNPATLFKYLDFYPDLALEFKVEEVTVKYQLVSALYFVKERFHFVSYCRLLNEDLFYCIDDTEYKAGKKFKIYTYNGVSRVPEEMKGNLNAYPSLLFYIRVDE